MISTLFFSRIILSGVRSALNGYSIGSRMEVISKPADLAASKRLTISVMQNRSLWPRSLLV